MTLQQIKSKERVKNLGEVFTPPWLVHDILNKVKLTKDSKVLEPTCGTGNFIVEIYKHLIKLGANPKQALSNIFAADICKANIKTSRSRMTELAIAEGVSKKEAESIVKSNIVLADFLVDQPFKSVKFTAILGNPPYQEAMQEHTTAQKPLYAKFIMLCDEYMYRYMSMVIPAKWYMGSNNLTEFKDFMCQNKSLKHIVDYRNCKEIFPDTKIQGGVMWFVIDKLYNGDCTVENVLNGKKSKPLKRSLDTYSILVRDNKAISILNKVIAYNNGTPKNPNPNPFKLVGMFGIDNIPKKFELEKSDSYPLLCHSYKQSVYIPRSLVKSNSDKVDKYKLVTSTAYGGDLWTAYSKLIIVPPNEVCSDTYTILYVADTLSDVFKVAKYLQTKLVGFLAQLARLTQHNGQNAFRFIAKPMGITYTDILQQNIYNLTKEEIDYIDEMTLKKVKIMFNGELIDD